MTNKDIEKAAERSTEKYVENGDLRGFRGSYRLGFIAGADWRINSVWHDANEIPKKNDSYIVVYNRFGIKTDFWSHYRGWEKYRRADKVKKWAYIEDLLPTKEDEQRKQKILKTQLNMKLKNWHI